MKKILNYSVPFILLILSFAFSGCPVGTSYPIGEPGTEKIDKEFIGTWETLKVDADMKSLTINKNDGNQYSFEVHEVGEMYSLETKRFNGWNTNIKGNSKTYNFFYVLDSADSQYYSYAYVFQDKNTLVIYDISLLVGGVDAITSIEAYRNEVIASMEMEGFLSNETIYHKK